MDNMHSHQYPDESLHSRAGEDPVGRAMNQGLGNPGWIHEKVDRLKIARPAPDIVRTPPC
jgi:hypothetical protein